MTDSPTHDSCSNHSGLNAVENCLEYAMFKRIARNAAVVKSQQINENELTLSEKENYIKELYNKNPQTILYRFGKYLNQEDLDLFKDSDDYDIQFYVERYKALLNPSHRKVIVKNRRYNYLKNVLSNSDYFDDQELKRSNPYLYKQYIGQYKRDDGKNRSGETFSDFLFRGIDDKISDFRCDLEEKAYEEIEYDTDSDDEDEGDVKDDLSDQEKNLLRQEFIDIVENNFLEGNENFDYSNIDDNEEYDNIDHDMEDEYFDKEEANEVVESSSQIVYEEKGNKGNEPFVWCIVIYVSFYCFKLW